MTQKTDHHQNQILEKAVAVFSLTQRQNKEDILPFIDELMFLSQTAGLHIHETFLQRLDIPVNATYIRKGKMEEIRDYIKIHDINIIVFDTELTSSQHKNLAEYFKCKIIDRPTLILDIFAIRAKTAQAKTQVELAQYQYLLPRLKGLWKHLERQGGGIGTRGPGETEIETDRRIVQKKISQLKNKLSLIERQAELRRKQRNELVKVALVGYTNVGKSSLMNLITKSETLVENKLFATLDTTTRKVSYNQTPFILSDTVGFIRNLPHHLIESFKSTLEEAKQSDIILHVIDISEKNVEEHIQVVNKTLNDLNITNKTTYMVFNKLDKFEEENIEPWILEEEKDEFLEEKKNRLIRIYTDKCFFISVKNKEGIEKLRKELSNEIQGKYKDLYSYKYFKNKS